MRRLLLTVVLLVVMAACFVPVYAERNCVIDPNVSIDDDDRALADGEYVYNVSGTVCLDEHKPEEKTDIDFDLTLVLENGKVISVTSTAEEGFMTIRNNYGHWSLNELPTGDYLIKEKACPDIVRFQKLTVWIAGHQHFEEKDETRISFDGENVYDASLEFSYVVKFIKPAITVGTEVFRKNAGLNHAQVLYFGGEGWDVIAYESAKGNGMQLDTDKALFPENSVTLFKAKVTEADQVDFNKTDTLHDWTNCYGWLYDSEGKIVEPKTPSTLRKFIEDKYIGENGTISTAEQAAILPKVLEGGGSNGYSIDKDKIRGDSVDDAKVWPLSRKEAFWMSGSIIKADYNWWLRTPGNEGFLAAYATTYGSFKDEGTEVSGSADGPLCARPAFNLDKDAVALTSDAVNGKKSGEAGKDALTEVEAGENRDWKVTLKDERFKDFKVDSVKTCNGEVLSVGYSGAQVASDGKCFLSAVIVNGSDVKYYGRIKALKNEDDKAGKALINIKGKLDVKAGDKLYVFNEQFNGDRKYKADGETVEAEASTDFASDLKEVAMPKEQSHDWKPATYTEPETCQICGATRGTPLDPTLKEPLDLRTAASTSGEGWAWDSASRTLTLNNFKMDLSKYQEGFDAGITLPDEGATIVVNEKTSTIALAGGKTKTVRDYNRLAVETKGDLKILGDGVGVLDIEATGGADGISADGSITIGDSDKLKGPAVEVYGTVVGMCANKSIGVYGSTVEAGNTGSQDQNSGAIIAANFDKEPGGIIVDHSDLTVSAVGEGAAGLGAIYGDICLMDSSVQQTPVDGASNVDGIVTMNGSVFIMNSQAYFDLGSGDKVGGSYLVSDLNDASYNTNRDVYIKDSTVRGVDADEGMYAYFGGADIINSTVDLTTTGYSIDCNFRGLTVSGSTVDLRSTGDYFAGCARVGGPLTIKDSTFTAKASGEMSSGISMNDTSKTVFSGKDTKISLEGTYSAIDFNNRKNNKTYPLTLKNNLTAVSGGNLQAVYDASDKSYTWSYSTKTLKAGKDGIMKNASKKVSFALGKTNTLKVSGKTYKISAKKLKKKSRTVKRAKVLKVGGAKGDVRYTKIKGNKKITINYKTGRVTLKKGLKKGKYKVTVKVFAAGNSTYGQAEKKATFTVAVKK